MMHTARRQHVTRIARLLRREQGQSLVIVVISMFAVIAICAFAIDVASWYRQHHGLQVAADAAALAAADQMAQNVAACSSDTTAINQVATNYVNSNPEPGSVTATSTVACPTSTGGASYVDVTVKNTKPGTFFSSLNPTISAHARVSLLAETQNSGYQMTPYSIQVSQAIDNGQLINIVANPGGTNVSQALACDGNPTGAGVTGTPGGAYMGNLEATSFAAGSAIFSSYPGTRGCQSTQVNPNALNSTCSPTTTSSGSGPSQTTSVSFSSSCCPNTPSAPTAGTNPPDCLEEFSGVDETCFDAGLDARFYAEAAIKQSHPGSSYTAGTSCGPGGWGGTKVTTPPCSADPYWPANNYASITGGAPINQNDTRLMGVYVVPNGSYGQNAHEIPIVGYAEMYMETGDHDPCESSGPGGVSGGDPNDDGPGTVSGYFLKYVNLSNNASSSGANCSPQTVTSTSVSTSGGPGGTTSTGTTTGVLASSETCVAQLTQ